MDIRKFFGGAGGGGTKPKPSNNSESTHKTTEKHKEKVNKSVTQKDSSKHKDKAEKHKEKPDKSVKENRKTVETISDDEFQRDENDNKKSRKGSESKKEKHKDSKGKKGKEDNEKEKKDKKSGDKKNKEEKREKLLDDSLIEIEDDSDTTEQISEKQKKPGSKERKNSKRKSTIDSDNDSDEVTGVKYKGKNRKRKKPVSSEGEEEDEEVIMKPKPKRKKKGKASQRILDSDSDEEPVPKKKREKKKVKLVHIGGSDDEEQEVKPKKTFMDKFLSSPQKPKPADQPKKSEPTRSESKEKKTEVSVSDFFGSGTVHRVEKSMTLTAIKDKSEAEKQASSFQIEDNDIEMHSDEDFEKTLELLDKEAGGESVAFKKTSAQESGAKSSPTKTKENAEKSSLSSKLAAKAKSVIPKSPEKKTVLVPDTPVSKQSSPSKASSGKPIPKRSKMEFIPTSKPSPPKPESKSSPKTSPVKTSSAKISPGKVSPTKVSPGKVSPKKPSPVKQDSETPNRGAGYRAYLHRAGPQALGSKEIPEGAENCLEGLTFVITGVLESLERDEAKSLVEKYGGKVTGNVSKKTSYLVAGRDSGQSKMSKAEQFHTKILDEDGLLDLIRTKPGKKSKYTIQAEEALKKEKSITESPVSKLESFKRDTPAKPSSSHAETSRTETSLSNSQSESAKQKDQSGHTLLWVDKYKPTQLKNIIGQQGDKSNCKKLLHWLNNWHRNQAAGVKPVQGKFFGRGGGSDDGAGFKAALLSGPPGIGKTTTATLVCKEAGFSFVEFNASDTRNAKSLKEVVSQAVGNQSIVDFVSGGLSIEETHGQKHCLIFDEVDGMSGNQDRGGMQELVHLIKNSKIPIITMCNDRNHPKIRTLSNYCFDLRFQRPRLEQIKAAVMSIAFKEGLTIPPPAVNEIILAANQDIRQVIHNLSLWTATDKTATYDQVKNDAQHAKKDMKIGPFDVCRKVFVGGEETNKMTFIDKSDLFFHDYSIAPLFVQENYVNVVPYASKNKLTRHLSLLSRTADAISDGDHVEKILRGRQNWTLLPTEAVYASVAPGEYMRGNISTMIAFPSWLGKNSTTGKTERILQELRTHMRLQISGDKRSLNMDYLPFLRNGLTDPLVKQGGEGVKDVISIMDTYDIIKDDFDNIMEITKFPNSRDPLSKLDSKTKAAFTRTYNKEVHMTPYSTGAVAKKRRGAAPVDTEDLLGEEEGGGGEGYGAEPEEDEEEDDNLEADTMIKKKTASKAKTASETKSKGKGPAKGKTAAKGKGKR